MTFTDSTITVISPAKINPGIDIIERLPNGYHTVRLILQTLDLCDRVTVHRADSADSFIKVTCSETAFLADERNLAYKAAKLLIDEFQLEGGLQITIDKKIPLAAGLAGGSGNAAAVLRAINVLFDLNLSQEELCARGIRIGADVPYCLMQGTALAEGIGEKLTPLPDLTEGCVLLVKPRIGISTQWAYETWETLEEKPHPDIDGMRELLSEGNKSLADLAPLMGNTFEPIIFGRYPEVQRIKEDLLNLGAAGALMSGSGPTMFGVFRDDESMRSAGNEMRSRYPGAFIVETHVRPSIEAF